MSEATSYRTMYAWIVVHRSGERFINSQGVVDVFPYLFKDEAGAERYIAQHAQVVSDWRVQKLELTINS